MMSQSSFIPGAVGTSEEKTAKFQQSKMFQLSSLENQFDSDSESSDVVPDETHQDTSLLTTWDLCHYI